MVTIAGGGVVLRPDEARTIDIGGFGVTVLADEDVTGGGFSLIETVETAEGWVRRSMSIATAPSRST